MPLLGALLTNLFAGLVAWLAQYFTRKVAFGVAGVAAMSSLTLALFVLMRVTLAGLNSQVIGMPEFWTMILGISVPPAAPFCVSSYLTIWTACTVYTWQRDLLHIVLKA